MIKPLTIALLAGTAALVHIPSASAEVDVHLRTFYLCRDFDGDTTEHREALTQALHLNYYAPITDSISVGASAYFNARIYDDGDSHLTGLLTTDNAEGYAKLGQIYADFSLTDITTLRVGRWITGTPLFNDSDSRATPSSTQAIKLTSLYKNGQAYLMYSDRAVSKTGSHFKKYEDSNGDDYGVAIIGGDYVLDNGVSFVAAYGYADDYKQQLYFNVGMPIGDSSRVALHHYQGEGDGANAAFDSDLTNLVASYVFEDLKLTIGYQTVSGDSGYDYLWGGEDDNGLQTSNSVQILDFNRLDEDSWLIRADYQVAAVPGLGVMARHTWGDYAQGNLKVDESETNVEMAYTIAGGTLEGMSLRLRASHVEGDAYDNIDEIRLIVNYGF
jgi:hypothetical protein